MNDTGKDRPGRLAGLAARAFILASVAAVILPMPRYARSLGDDQWIVWAVRLCWVMLLSVGMAAVLLLVGFLARRLKRN